MERRVALSVGHACLGNYHSFQIQPAKGNALLYTLWRQMMGFEPGRKRGQYWESCKKLDEIIRDFPFHTTGKSEKDFETGFSTVLMAREKDFRPTKVITQIDKASTVQSVYCFGKNHRPDITLGDDGAAIELKFVTYAGLREAIGQGFLYRLRYKFAFLILIISEDRASIYNDLAINEEKDLHDTLRYLADTINIFTYVVPAFVPKPGIKKCISFFAKE